jgi:integrase
MSPAQTRLTALLVLELDTAARSGELVGLRTTDLGKGNGAVYVERRPQGGGTVEGEWVETSALTRAALESPFEYLSGLF